MVFGSHFFLLHSLPPRRVFLLPQREHDGVSLPLPAVSQLPALSGLLLEGPCQRFPQQPAPNERVHVMGKGRLPPCCRLLCPPAIREAPSHSSGQLGAGLALWISDPVWEAVALGAIGRAWRWDGVSWVRIWGACDGVCRAEGSAGGAGSRAPGSWQLLPFPQDSR